VDSSDSDSRETHNKILETSRELLARIKAALERQGVEPPEEEAEKRSPKAEETDG
jgi:hypothetical protein